MPNEGWNVDPQWVIIAVALLLGLGLRDGLKALFFRPRLDVFASTQPPEGHKTSMGRQRIPCYYFNLRVKNHGRCPMLDVDVLLSSVEESRGIWGFRRRTTFLPMNLTWAHINNPTMPNIQPGLFKHCNLGRICETKHANLTQYGIAASPTVVFQLETTVHPYTGCHILLPGEYRLELIFSARNLRPCRKKYRLKLEDRWTNNEMAMLNNNIDIEEIPIECGTNKRLGRHSLADWIRLLRMTGMVRRLQWLEIFGRHKDP